ncbi:ABC transporter permease [Litoreibacter roseus]|uniref:Drug:proton antiporter n=1 Tax=Litoreibacter roseus TaxID=2601869 RepID=A0A6N6JCY4_9RHOB|nr:FtsX-like permease family protein [Litoreibacter roseus]GFE64201.1 drug:proton antiporter [Litoreibacter roseus]
MSTLRMAAKIARRELTGGLKGFRVFLACLALGVAAIAAIGIVRAGIEAGLEREGAAILGGDAAVQLTYRFAEPDERQWLEDTAVQVSEIADFRSMLVVDRDGQTERGLTQVKAVDDAYPIYGTVRLTPDMTLQDALANQDGIPGVVIDPVLVDRLGLSIGDAVRLGLQEFVLTALIDSAPDEAAGGFGLGPRTIVATEALEASGLLGAGTLFETEYRLKVSEDQDLTALRTAVEERFSDAGIRWRDRRNGAPGVSEFVDRLSAFLVLVGLTGLAVGGVGVAAAVRSYLDEKTTVIATLRSLGADARTIFLTYILQIGALALFGIAIGLVLGALIPILLTPTIEARLPVPAAIAIRPGPLLEAGLYGLLAAAIFTIWPLARTENVRPSALFRDTTGGADGSIRPIWILTTGALLIALVGLAAILSGLITLTLWAAGAILGAFIVLLVAADLIRRLSKRLSQTKTLRGAPTVRSAVGAIGGQAGETKSVIISLGLGLSVLAAVGQIDWNLRNAIAQDLPEVAPSYFVVDIQNDQLDGIRGLLAANPAVTDVQSAPMLRGVITMINDTPAEEVAGDHWVLQGDRGITYSALPNENTKITSGAWWEADYTGPPQISFATEEAMEMGLALGDTLTINVLGRDITAEITSFREVDFSTAGIGFILSMNPAALQGAPHTHIATIYADEAAEGQILRDIASAYPNITAIRVRDAIARVSEVLAGIAAAVTYGALATLITGGIVLIGTAAAGERARIYEGAILKTLGAPRRAILINFALRSAFLGLTAGIIAIFAGVLAGWAVTTFVMDTDFRVEPVSAFGIVAGGILVTVLTGLLFAWRPLSARPAQVLRARE